MTCFVYSNNRLANQCWNIYSYFMNSYSVVFPQLKTKDANSKFSVKL